MDGLIKDYVELKSNVDCWEYYKQNSQCPFCGSSMLIMPKNWAEICCCDFEEMIDEMLGRLDGYDID